MGYIYTHKKVERLEKTKSRKNQKRRGGVRKERKKKKELDLHIHILKMIFIHFNSCTYIIYASHLHA